MRLPSGVPGFDEMVEGGLPAGACVVLQGPPGREKLRFALTFLAEGLKSGAAGLIVVSSNSPDSILTELRSLGVDLDQVISENRLRIVDWYSQREEPVQDVEEKGIVVRSSIDLTNVGVALTRAIAALGGDKPRRAVVEILSPATSVFEVGQVYAFAQSSKGKFVRFNYTALYLIEKEMHGAPQLSTLHQPFDGVVEIERGRTGDRIVRKIGVLHLKDTSSDAAFHVLEDTPSGLKVVRDAGPPPAARSAKDRPPDRTMEPAPEEATKGSPAQASFIVRIARERLRLNPADPDALFATAAAQAQLDDPRGALDALERLARIDERYPGLWVLKAKLHARLGDVVNARVSRVRAEEAAQRLGEDAITLPCPSCGTMVADALPRCPSCGANLGTDDKIVSELLALGQVAIQEGVEGDLEAPSRGGAPKAASTTEKTPPRPAAPPRKKPPTPDARIGLTNGLAKDRTKTRAPGMTNGLRGRTNGTGRTNGLTNGLRGRTNGLRGRTNGLTNGVGRTNGLTNGLRGRTNGLTNGLGRTNGLTNGMGRTNGLTNGLVSLRRGITNGLTNGNGFTNGLGSRRFQREARLGRWKLYVIPLVAVGLMLLPLFIYPETEGPYPIQIDGSFADWSTVPLASQSLTLGVNPDVDIQRLGIADNGWYIAFYVEVAGQAFSGGGTPSRYDTLRLFLETDRDPSTGYDVAGIGADHLVEISGIGGSIQATVLQKWDGNRPPSDWNGWIRPVSIEAAIGGSRAEFQVEWALLLESKAPVLLYAHFQSYDGTSDEGDAVMSSVGPSLLVEVAPSTPEILAGPGQEMLRLNLRCSRSACTFSSLNVTVVGTAGPSSVGSLSLRDGLGGLIDQTSPVGSVAAFSFPSRVLLEGQGDTLVLFGDVIGTGGGTLGLDVRRPVDVGVAAGAVTLRPKAVARALGYVGFIPSGVRVDGAFSDWTNVSIDPAEAGRRPDVDLQGYSVGRTGSGIAVFLQVGGRVFNGTVIPQENRAAGSPPGGAADSDRDMVPDAVDPLPFDFNNDGVDDVATNQDYDGDAIQDYPYGPDAYLNTTIPSNFPVPYANRPVSLFIGPSSRPVLIGEDVARVFFDADNSTATGFRINTLGADYLLQIRGRSGIVTGSTLSAFAGLSPLFWSWNVLQSVPAATDFARAEAGFSATGLGFVNGSAAYFEIRDWTGIPDGLVDPIFRVDSLGFVQATPGPLLAQGVHTLDIAGNQKWFFTNGATSATSCTTNYAASTTAGASATSTTLSTAESAICWFTPTNPPSTNAGPWEVILDIDKASDGTKALRPSGNGDVNDWGTSGCTDPNEYQCVDDNPNDGDSTYIVSTSNLVTLDSLFNIFDWSGSSGQPPSPLSVVNIRVEGSCRRIAAPAVGVRVLVKSGGTTSVGTTAPDCLNSATYTTWSDTWTTDPSDSAAWTLSDINSLQIGVRDVDGFNRELRVSHVMATVTFLPAYTVQIDKCTNTACTTFTTLYGPTNSNTYGSDVTFTTPSIPAQTFTGNDRIRFLVQLNGTGTSQNHGSVTVRYNGPNPGTDDSRGTISIPEFGAATVTVATVTLVVAFRRWRACRLRPKIRPERAT